VLVVSSGSVADVGSLSGPTGAAGFGIESNDASPNRLLLSGNPGGPGAAVKPLSEGPARGSPPSGGGGTPAVLVRLDFNVPGNPVRAGMDPPSPPGRPDGAETLLRTGTDATGRPEGAGSIAPGTAAGAAGAEAPVLLLERPPPGNAIGGGGTEDRLAAGRRPSPPGSAPGAGGAAAGAGGAAVGRVAARAVAVDGSAAGGGGAAAARVGPSGSTAGGGGAAAPGSWRLERRAALDDGA